MVRAADIEALFDKYLEEHDLARADTLRLVLMYGLGCGDTILIRYGKISVLNDVLAELKDRDIDTSRLGDHLGHFEDVPMTIRDTVSTMFKVRFLDILREHLVKNIADLPVFHILNTPLTTLRPLFSSILFTLRNHENAWSNFPVTVAYPRCLALWHNSHTGLILTSTAVPCLSSSWM